MRTLKEEYNVLLGLIEIDGIELTIKQARTVRAKLNRLEGGGKPLDPDRCPCGKFTARYAAKRGHVCQTAK